MKSYKEFDINTVLDGVGACFFSLKRRGKKLIGDSRYDLTIEQVIALTILKNHEGLNLSDLAELSDRDKTTTSRMVTGLEKRNLVLRVPDKPDSRQKMIYLTHEAKGLLDEVEALKDGLGKVAYQGLTGEELAACRQVLEKIVENLNSE